MVEMLGLKKPLPTEINDSASSMIAIVMESRSAPACIAPFARRRVSCPLSSSEIVLSSFPRICSFLP